MPSVITPQQRHWWKIALELKLRRCNGDAFQDFFSTVMTLSHGDDFVRVRAFGKLGDKGCDGYLQSCGHVYQCYGALNGSTKVKTLTAKMETDFAKALAGVPSIMKHWHMVHNMVDGLPSEALITLGALKSANDGLGFSFFGHDGFESRIFALEMAKLEDLLGVVATSQDAQNLQPAELRDLVGAVAALADQLPVDVNEVRPVSVDKLDFNKLPPTWRWLIANGWQNAHHVDDYLARHSNPLIGEHIAQVLRVRYRYLKAQDLPPGEIMTSLYELVTGSPTGSIAPARQVASQALLAFLFESCDIFEDDSAKVA